MGWGSSMFTAQTPHAPLLWPAASATLLSVCQTPLEVQSPSLVSVTAWEQPRQWSITKLRERCSLREDTEEGKGSSREREPCPVGSAGFGIPAQSTDGNPGGIGKVY